jgi:hypothetical protein
MDHQEKVQMLAEIQEIRALIMQLNQPTGSGADTGKSGGGGGGVPMLGKGRRVLDLF